MIKEIEKEIQKCYLCEAVTKLRCNTNSYGSNTDILFIGESPAKNGWIVTGKAFYDINNKLLPTGKVLNELLKIINLTINEITFTEACKCCIPDRRMLKQSSINCLPFLEKQIVELGSKIIVPLGEHPTRILLNEKFNKFADVVGKVYEKNILGKNVLIIPIYHPSPINPKGYKNNLPIFEKIGDLI
jgi:uracil-DNA glycosylase family 4